MTGAPMPFRSNLVIECVRVMELRIASGEWDQVLPGERRLAEMLQVGRDTIRLTLKHLEQDGVLAAVDVTNRRRILVKPEGPSELETRPLKIGLLTHRKLERLQQPMLLEIDRIRDALAAKGGVLEVYAPPWYEQRNPAKRLATLVAEQRCSAWILLRSSEAVQTWFMNRHIPALIRGYPHPGIDLPHLDVDWYATARHAAGQLWRMGHRRILVARPSELLKGTEAAIQGMQDLGEAEFEVSVVVEDGTTDGLKRCLAQALQVENPPTAMIAIRSRQVVTTLTWLASRRIRVPQDFSLISLAWEPFLDHMVPDISSYQVDPDAVAKLVVRRMERLASGDSNIGGNAWITPEMSKGASVRKL